MATRSSIARQLPDETILCIYCHHDGYYDHVGKLLESHYSTPEKAKELIELGGLSS